MRSYRGSVPCCPAPSRPQRHSSLPLAEESAHSSPPDVRMARGRDARVLNLDRHPGGCALGIAEVTPCAQERLPPSGAYRASDDWR